MIHGGVVAFLPAGLQQNIFLLQLAVTHQSLLLGIAVVAKARARATQAPLSPSSTGNWNNKIESFTECVLNLPFL